MKLKGDLGGQPPEVLFEFHELCYRGEPTRAFLHACLVERLQRFHACRAVARSNFESRAMHGKFTMHGSRLEIRPRDRAACMEALQTLHKAGVEKRSRWLAPIA